MRRSARGALLCVALLAALPAHALNKQGARDSQDDSPGQWIGVSGFVFGGVMMFNPTYAARPNNSGRTLFRFGLHLDIDFLRYFSVSYDENTFTDGSSDSTSPLAPSEHDHIIGLLGHIALGHRFKLTLAAHYEIDAPGFEPNDHFRSLHANCRTGEGDPPGCYSVGYAQSYADVYARIEWARGPLSLAAAVGAFVYNPTYAARPDNSGLALFRYVLHGELTPLPWLFARLDFNMFTDRDGFALAPTELDAVAEVGVRHGAWELRLSNEADIPLGRYQDGGPHPPVGAPHVTQLYIALLGQAYFELFQR